MNAATPLDRAENSWYRLFDNPSPLLKQAPTAIAIVISALVAWLNPELPFTNGFSALAGLVLVLGATVQAAALSMLRVYEGWVVLIIPMIDILGLGLFRAGTGGAASVFGSPPGCTCPTPGCAALRSGIVAGDVADTGIGGSSTRRSHASRQ